MILVAFKRLLPILGYGGGLVVSVHISQSGDVSLNFSEISFK